MSHQTFAIITCTVGSEEHFLLLKNEQEELHFFTWLDRAINGFHQWTAFAEDFQKYFKISDEQYESFRRERLAIDKADKNKERSTALVKITVPEFLYQRTKEYATRFTWVSGQTAENIKEKIQNLVDAEKWIIPYLFRGPLDGVDLPATLFETLKKIQEAREKNKLVIFAGAGVSVDSGAPLWWETGKAILQTLGLPENTIAEAPVIGQWLYNERGEKEYNDKLREILRYHKNLQPNPIHSQLLRLRPRHLITTNYDDLLEKAQQEGQRASVIKPYTFIRRDDDLPYALTDEYIVKMHGDWDLMNFVFKEDDYLNYSRNFPLIESFVKGIFSSHLVLFVGFSFSDPNLKQIVNWVKEILGSNFQPAYLFQLNPPKPYEAVYFREKGIKPVVFDEAISSYLEEADERPCKERMSRHGRSTYEFLRLIEVFNYRDFERLKNARSQHVIDQLYEAVHQFDAFNCIPPYSFEKLFPFSPTRLHPAKSPMLARHDTGYHLQTSNEDIIALMESLEFKDNWIHLRKGSSDEMAITQVEDFDVKLAYIFDKLRSRQIHCIQRQNDHNNHNRIGYGTQFEENLIFTQWLNFQFKPMLESINAQRWESAGQPVRPLRERLLDAFILARFHFYKEAYALYSTIEHEALKRQDYTIFFICQHNKIYVGNLLLRVADFRKYSEEVVAQVEEETKNIDLPHLLKTINPVADVKELLEDILQKEFLDFTTRKVKAAHKGVLKDYIFFQKPNNESLWGRNDAFKLLEKYITLHWFYHSNGILLGWDNHKFRELTELAFEGMVASICTAKRSKGRLEEASIEMLRLACHFLEAKWMAGIFQQYELKELPIGTEEGKKQFVVFADNWFSSCYDEGLFFGSERENDKLSRYVKEKVYQTELEFLSNNFLLLLAYIELGEMKDLKEVKELVDKILKALSVNSTSRLGHFISMEFFLLFLERQIELFTDTQIALALKTLTQSQGLPVRFGYRLFRLFNKSRPDFKLATGDFFVEYLTEENRLGRRLEDCVFLYPFLSQDLQRNLLDKINFQLGKEKGEGLLLWMYAKYIGLYPTTEEMPKKTMTELQSLFTEIDAVSFENDGEAVIRWSAYAVNFPYWLAMLHYKPEVGLGKKTVQKLLKLKSLPSSLRWMLDPKGFDYKNFNCYWVFFFDGRGVLSKIGAMKIPALRRAFQRELKKEFSPKLAEVYHACFSVG